MIVIDGICYADDMRPNDPFAVKVKPLPDYWLEVEFDNGETRRYDMKGYLDRGWWKELTVLDAFKRVKVKDGIVKWSSGHDLAPDVLYPNSIPT